MAGLVGPAGGLGLRAGRGVGGEVAGRVGPGGAGVACRVGQGGGWAGWGGGWAGMGRLQ